MTRCIILAAGRGSRLHPYTADCPKCLTELGGVSLIDQQIATLRSCGIDDIVVVNGYRAELLRPEGTRQRTNEKWDSTNMVESLFVAEDLFADDLIVSYSDIIYEPKVLRALLECDEAITVVVDKAWREYWSFRFDDPLSDAESLRIDERGLISEIGNKVENINEIEAQYIGLMRFRSEGVDTLVAAHKSMYENDRPWQQKRPVEKAYMTDLLMEVILMGGSVTPVPISSGWLEIDTVEDYEKAAAMFADGSVQRFYTPRSDRVSG